VLYISRRNGKSSEQHRPIPKEHPDLSVLVMRFGFILRKNFEKEQPFSHPMISKRIYPNSYGNTISLMNSPDPRHFAMKMQSVL
jgi:hypothetical protein